MNAHLAFLGMSIEIAGDDEVVDEVRRDFAWFSAPEGQAGQPRVCMTLRKEEPPFRDLPAIPAAFSTPRNYCFRQGDVSYVDYFGRGLTIHDRGASQCVLYATDHDLLHEMAYLFILSTVGQHLDRQRIHRLHALGVSYRGHGILLLLPSGGGKSTTALRLLERPGFRLLGEDTPLIDRRGQILPFPLRLGVRPEQQTGIPARYLRTMNRMEFDPKTLIDIEYFRDRLGTETAPGLLLVGQRNLGEISAMVPLGRLAAFRALVSNMVVGLGVYQGLEFLLERSAWELLGQAGVVASRVRNSVALLQRVATYRFVMGRNVERNVETLVDLVHERYGPVDEATTARGPVPPTAIMANDATTRPATLASGDDEPIR